MTITPNRKLTWKYIPEHSETVTNTGYCWKVHVKGKGSELSGGPLNDKYMLEQFHCHWGGRNDHGSEHTVNGVKYAGELHLVHWNTRYSSFEESAKYPDGLCVLGIFLRPGKCNRELNKLVAQFDRIMYKDQTVKLGLPVDPARLIPEESTYWTYQGSLTTPPCSECVVWIVFKEPIEVSHEQLKSFRSLRSLCREDEKRCTKEEGYVKCNYRPPLPVGTRKVKECRR